MICYKVVNQINGRFFSSNMSRLDRARIENLKDPAFYLEHNNFLEYKIGEWTFPRLGRIFTFQNSKEAKLFNFKYQNQYIILKCQSKGGIIGYPSAYEQDSSFWNPIEQKILNARKKHKRFQFEFDEKQHFEYKSLLCLAVKPLELC